MKQVIQKFPLATVISQTKQLPMVTQVPLIFMNSDENTLFGHFDLNNPHSQVIQTTPSVYCLFNTPNQYVSPSIYPDEHYPGWVYVSVHVAGEVEVIDDKELKKEVILELSEQNEPKNSGYELKESQDNFYRYLQMIQMFRINIAEMNAVVKLAQDKGPEHALLATQHLAKMTREDLSVFFEQLLK